MLASIILPGVTIRIIVDNTVIADVGIILLPFMLVLADRIIDANPCKLWESGVMVCICAHGKLIFVPNPV